MKNHNTSTNRIEVKESKSEMLKLCRYGYGNFKKQKTIIPSNNMILNTTVQIFRLLLTRKYVCQLVPINCDFSGPAERVRLMTCRLIGNYHDSEFMLQCVGAIVGDVGGQDCRAKYIFPKAKTILILVEVGAQLVLLIIILIQIFSSCAE